MKYLPVKTSFLNQVCTIFQIINFTQSHENEMCQRKRVSFYNYIKLSYPFGEASKITAGQGVGEAMCRELID